MVNMPDIEPTAQKLIVSEARVKITNLRLRTYIGFNPEEKTKKQDIIINAEIHYDAGCAMVSDDHADALNYKTITKRIIQHVENGHFQLLEKLTADVLVITSEPERVTHSEVRIDKPHALRFADSVSVSLSARRGRHNGG